MRILSRVFRGKFLERVRQAYEGKRLVLPPWLAELVQPDAFARWLTPLYRQEWVVYAKPPFGGPEQVLKYLARYTHRVAISNQRLVSLEDGQVTFRYKDYAADQRAKTMTLTAEEFFRRFVQHVLPNGFVKIRHYGLTGVARTQRTAGVVPPLVAAGHRRKSPDCQRRSFRKCATGPGAELSALWRIPA